MSVKIRLKRMGAKKKPFYRVVVVDSRSARDGKFIEEIGYFNPLNDEIKIDTESAQKWISNGAQPSERVRTLLRKVEEEAPKAAPAVEPVAEEPAVVEAATEEGDA